MPDELARLESEADTSGSVMVIQASWSPIVGVGSQYLSLYLRNVSFVM
jgi:hypothetical protein